jgi:hypothetical protein
MGLPVGLSKVLIYALAALCSTLAGVVYTFYTQSGDPAACVGQELDVVRAARGSAELQDRRREAALGLRQAGLGRLGLLGRFRILGRLRSLGRLRILGRLSLAHDDGFLLRLFVAEARRPGGCPRAEGRREARRPSKSPVVSGAETTNLRVGALSSIPRRDGKRANPASAKREQACT